MVNPEEILKSTKTYIDTLRNELNNVNISLTQQVIINSREFRYKDILETHINKIKLNKNPIIYTIQVSRADVSPLKKLFEKFTIINKKRVKNVDRINLSKYNDTDSEFLYVGSSINNIRTRIKNHLGVMSSKRTYSMHLCKWDQNIDYNLKFCFYEVHNTDNAKIIESIEQQFWDFHTPIFGKRSGL